MKTTKKQFKQFVNHCKYWAKKLGLTQYRIDYYHCRLKGSYAEIEVNERDKVVSISFNNNPKSPVDIPGTALHEILHLATHRLRWLGEARYIENCDLDEEWEALVRRLEKCLSKS